MSAPSPPQRDAIRFCARVLDDAGSSFAAAIGIVPPPQRQAMTALYAYCRLVDDAVDEAESRPAARSRVAAWEEELDRVARGDPLHPVGVALRWALDGSGARAEYLRLILDGVRMDIDVARFRTFGDLYGYCFRVASAVGLFTVDLFGATDRESRLYAELTGVAVQLTNILRDVRRDAALGRIYLPEEDMALFGVTAGDVLRGGNERGKAALVAFEARRARDLYRLAGAALPPEARARLFFAEAIRETYARLLDRIAAAGGEVFTRDVGLARWEKAGVALKWRLGASLQHVKQGSVHWPSFRKGLSHPPPADAGTPPAGGTAPLPPGASRRLVRSMVERGASP